MEVVVSTEAQGFVVFCFEGAIATEIGNWRLAMGIAKDTACVIGD